MEDRAHRRCCVQGRAALCDHAWHAPLITRHHQCCYLVAVDRGDVLLRPQRSAVGGRLELPARPGSLQQLLLAAVFGDEMPGGDGMRGKVLREA